MLNVDEKHDVNKVLLHPNLLFLFGYNVSLMIQLKDEYSDIYSNVLLQKWNVMKQGTMRVRNIY